MEACFCERYGIYAWGPTFLLFFVSIQIFVVCWVLHLWSMIADVLTGSEFESAACEIDISGFGRQRRKGIRLIVGQRTEP
ncbi:hypothetical protein QQP08_018862 [Theobroma cacao]|nr:hypothetical protein QQP08_018862 [Theobroma cacao]